MPSPPSDKTGHERDDDVGQSLPAAVAELPVVARLNVEIRSDGSRTIARGAMEDAASDTRLAIEASGASPLELALALAKSMIAAPWLRGKIMRGGIEGIAEEVESERVGGGGGGGRPAAGDVSRLRRGDVDAAAPRVREPPVAGSRLRRGDVDAAAPRVREPPAAGSAPEARHGLGRSPFFPEGFTDPGRRPVHLFRAGGACTFTFTSPPQAVHLHGHGLARPGSMRLR